MRYALVVHASIFTIHDSSFEATSLVKMASTISVKSIGPLTQSKYLKPMEVHYELNGTPMKWDYVQVHDSVQVIIFNVTRKVFICVKQFRPIVYVHQIPKEERTNLIDHTKYPMELGQTLEFCGGLADKGLSYEQTAKEEILEETGYDVPIEKLEKVKIYRAHVSRAANLVHMYYVEVEDGMRVGEGGGVAEEGEIIDIVEISLDEAKKICEDSNADNQYIALVYGFLWFFHVKMPKLNLH